MQHRTTEGEPMKDRPAGRVIRMTYGDATLMLPISIIGLLLAVNVFMLAAGSGLWLLRFVPDWGGWVWPVLLAVPIASIWIGWRLAVAVFLMVTRVALLIVRRVPLREWKTTTLT